MENKLWTTEFGSSLNELSENKIMGLFSRNPMEAAWSTKRKVCFLFYLAFYLLSAWVTSESLLRSFPVSSLSSLFLARAFWFIVAMLFLGLASFCLRNIREVFGRGRDERRFIKLLINGPVFLVLWFFILMANTHGLYYIMTINDQRQNELRDIQTQLELIKTNSESAFRAAKVKFTNEIEGEIKNMNDEIINRNNPGRGDETNKIINRISEKLGNIDMPTNAPTSASGRAQYADDLARKIREITLKKLSVVDTKINDLDNFLKKEEFQKTQSMLEDLITNYGYKDEKELSLGLRNSYSTYNKVQQYIASLFLEPLISKYAEFPARPLPTVPISIQSEAIAYVWGEYFVGGGIDIVKFRWAALFGLIFDLGCYVFWYFGVLPDDE